MFWLTSSLVYLFAYLPVYLFNRLRGYLFSCLTATSLDRLLLYLLHLLRDWFSTRFIASLLMRVRDCLFVDVLA